MVFRYLITVFSCIRHHRNLNQFILTFLSEKIWMKMGYDMR
ncbi:hypothetical protein LTSEWAN_0074, partial [Salmonella enterica subsp. enterica serovar Wandsworth str. A4-580]